MPGCNAYHSKRSIAVRQAAAPPLAKMTRSGVTATALAKYKGQPTYSFRPQDRCVGYYSRSPGDKSQAKYFKTWKTVSSEYRDEMIAS